MPSQEETEVRPIESTGEQSAKSVVPQADPLVPSPSTEESVTTYIERTLTEEDANVSLLAPQTPGTKDEPNVEAVGNETDSNGMEKVIGNRSPDTQGPSKEVDQADVVREVSSCPTKSEYFQTDISDFEDLLDSPRAEPVKDQATLKSMDFGTAISTENTRSSAPELIAGVVTLTTPKLPDPSRPHSASAQTLIRKYFTKTTPPILPVGHATVAFNEHQVHSVLLAVSDETAITSSRLMKNMPEEAMRIRARLRHGTPGLNRQRVLCFRSKSASSVADASQSGDETEGYSSGVLRALKMILTLSTLSKRDQILQP